MSEPMMMNDMAASERPRERLHREGAKHLRNDELVAILLRTGTKGRSVLTIAQEMVGKYETLNNLSRATVDELRQIKGVGRDKAATLVAAYALARRMADEIAAERPYDTPAAIADLLREEVRQHTVEHFYVVLLNVRRHLIRREQISSGTLDTLLVHPREVFRHAIAANASAIVLAHNHPSGDPSPSEADIKVTRDLIRAGQLLRIDVLDHVIIGRQTPTRRQDFLSLRELGYFYK